MCTRVAHVQPAVKRPRLIRKLDATGYPEPMLREKCTRSSDKKKETSFTTKYFYPNEIRYREGSVSNRTGNQRALKERKKSRIVVNLSILYE